MPVCRVALYDVSRLVGEELDVETLSDLLPRLKCEVEGVEGGYVEYEATHDRPDLFSAEGLARALRGLLGFELGLRTFRVERSGKAFNEGPSYRPYILLATVHGLSLDDEAIVQVMQLQEKLHATYGRDRRRVSIGVYDLSKVTFPVRYVEADPDSNRFVPLDFEEEMSLRKILERHPKGVQYAHLLAGKERYPLLLDSRGRVLSMPPIVNSEETRVTERTRDILIDVTATDRKAAEDVLAVVTTALAERGEKIGLVEVLSDEGSWLLSLEPGSVEFDVELVERVVGVRLTAEEAAECLKRMRLGAEAFGTTVKALVPVYRLDVLHPIDLVEDVAMGYGLDKLVPEFMPPQHAGREDRLELFCRKLRELVAGFGFQEVLNYMLTSKEVLYGLTGAPEVTTVEVLNPRQSQYSCLRTWLTPQLLQVLSKSKHADYPQKVFECGDVVLVDERYENSVREERRLAMAICDSKVTLTDMHAVIDSLMKLLGLRYKLVKSAHPTFIGGRYATVEVEGVNAGFVGEVHPQVLVNWGLEKPVVAAELNVNALFGLLAVPRSGH